MAVKDPTTTQIQTLTADGGTRDPFSGLLFIPLGRKPAYEAMNTALYHASRSGPLRVRKDDANDTTVRVLPGSAIIAGALVTYAGGTIDLAAYNNDTAYVWLTAAGALAAATDGTGWPAAAHLKLASVVLAAGTFAEADITDLRPQLHQAAAQADSVAADVAALVVDFNALLAKLRTAGTLAP